MQQAQLKELLQEMSLKEKVDQMLQIMGVFYQEDVEGVLTGPARDMGLEEEDIYMAGSILGTAGAEKLINIQKKYMEKQPHHIPMLFMMDVIHGMKTIHRRRFLFKWSDGSGYGKRTSGNRHERAGKNFCLRETFCSIWSSRSGKRLQYGGIK